MATPDNPPGGYTAQATGIALAQHWPQQQDAARADQSPAVILDTDKYRALLADEALSADQERNYIESVWAILLQVMLLGIRLEFDPESCGKDSKTPSPPPISGEAAVQLNDQEFKLEFNSAAGEVRTAEGRI